MGRRIDTFSSSAYNRTFARHLQRERRVAVWLSESTIKNLKKNHQRNFPHRVRLFQDYNYN